MDSKKFIKDKINLIKSFVNTNDFDEELENYNEILTKLKRLDRFELDRQEQDEFSIECNQALHLLSGYIFNDKPTYLHELKKAYNILLMAVAELGSLSHCYNELEHQLNDVLLDNDIMKDKINHLKMMLKLKSL